MNRDKTELLVLSPSHLPRPQFGNLEITNEIESCYSTVRNIVVLFDDSLSVVAHVTAVRKSTFYHLRNISRIRKFLTCETTKTIIHASSNSYASFVLSKLPACIHNSIYAR